MFKSGTDLYNADLDNEADTVSFYNCSTLGYNATYNIANTDTTVTVSTVVPASNTPVAVHHHEVHNGVTTDDCPCCNISLGVRILCMYLHMLSMRAGSDCTCNTEIVPLPPCHIVQYLMLQY